jgi:hypothetical protein
MENQAKKYFNVLRSNEYLSFPGLQTLKLIENEFDRLSKFEEAYEKQLIELIAHEEKLIGLEGLGFSFETGV